LDLITSSAEALRRLVSAVDDPPLELLVETGVIPYILDVISDKNMKFDGLIEECSWIISNLASGRSEYNSELMKYDILDRAILILGHKSHGI